MSAALLPGFADPVQNSQLVFRALLDAMARPGRIAQVPLLAAPAPLDPAAAALLLTLVDADTPLFLDHRARAAADWLAFHCGVPLAAAEAEAQFALLLDPPRWSAFDPGTDEEPERAATVIAQVEAIGAGQSFLLSGPGLAAPAPLAVTGLAPDFPAFWASNHRLFPRGIDVILVAGDQFVALPRTVQLECR